MLVYKETNWKYQKGFETRNYDVVINTILSSKTRKEQQTKTEKISLVAFLNKGQRRFLENIGRRIKKNDKDFYINKNLHATLFGFGPLKKSDYERIHEKIQQFCREKQLSTKRDTRITISFYEVRPGTMYLKNDTLIPLHGKSNGTVIAIGNVVLNEEFCNFSNKLSSFLLSDKNIKSVLGANFRRKFPGVWITLGYYNKSRGLKIGNDLENIFKQYGNLNSNALKYHISEISLVRSKYKNLRYPKLIHKFTI